MWKAELMKYKKESILILNQSGSSYLSPVLAVQGPALFQLLGQNHIDRGISFPNLWGKTPTSVLSFDLKIRLCEA